MREHHRAPSLPFPSRHRTHHPVRFLSYNETTLPPIIMAELGNAWRPSKLSIYTYTPKLALCVLNSSITERGTVLCIDVMVVNLALTFLEPLWTYV